MLVLKTLYVAAMGLAMAGVATAQNVKIMALGDSITGSPVRIRQMIFTFSQPFFTDTQSCSGVLARLSLAKATSRRNHQYRLRRNTRRPRVRLLVRRRERGPRRLPCNQYCLAGLAEWLAVSY